MKSYLRFGVSAVALIAAISLGYAETSEHPNEHGERGNATHGSEGKKPAQPQQGKAVPEHGSTKATEQPKHQGRAAEDQGKGLPKTEDRSAQERRQEDQNRTTKQQKSAASERSTAERADNRGGREHPNVTPEHRTQLVNLIHREHDMHVYHRNDLRFNLAVGTRIPDTISFYDAPSQHLSIDPEFQGYKIVILDDVVLIIDPDTRERRSHPNVGGQAPNTQEPITILIRLIGAGTHDIRQDVCRFPRVIQDRARTMDSTRLSDQRIMPHRWA
jgi:hypothetical protein